MDAMTRVCDLETDVDVCLCDMVLLVVISGGD